MHWLDEAIEHLITQPVCGYSREEPPTVEPTALAALALMAAGRGAAVMPALDWLLNVQSADGSLGIDADARQPCWPTGWAILAWNAAVDTIPAAKAEWPAAATRAVAWMLTLCGRPVEYENKEQCFVGHDTTLQGWPWVEGTHSWVEPTAINVLALRRANQADHPRCREAVKLLLDRQLSKGGWNYGNTTVLGHVLRPQVQPTGLALAALAGESEIRPKVQHSLNLLTHTLSPRTTTASLCYAVMGLAEHGVWPHAAGEWLSSAYQRTLARHGSPYHAALLILTGMKAKSHESPT
jgi:hypothetical protein